MRRTLGFGVAMVGLFAAQAGACGGGSGNTGGSGGTGGSTSTSTTHTTSTVSTTSTGTGGMMGNHSFDTAMALDYNNPVDGDLSPVGAVDFYSFQGTKGQAVSIDVFAQRQVSGAALDPTWIDTVVTLFDANKTQIGENNDRVPPRYDNDSDLITILPADGTYYVRVEECWSWAQNPTSTCAGTKMKDNTAYRIEVDLLDPTQPSIVADAETGNDGASATSMTFGKGSKGYYYDILYGTYASATDVDVFKFTLPGDYINAPAGTRPVVSFYPLPSSSGGDGSTTQVGRVSLVDPSTTPATTVAAFFVTDFTTLALPRLWPNIDVTKQYQLWVEHPQGALGTNDFYVFIQNGGYSNPVETNESANDDPATPEMPVDKPDTNGTHHHYYVDGDIVSDSDKDHWLVPVSAGVGQISVSCASQRGGSGLRGFTADVLDAANPTTVLATATETAATDLYTGYQSIPAGVTSVLVRMSTGQPHDATVASSFYHCGIHLK